MDCVRSLPLVALSLTWVLSAAVASAQTIAADSQPYPNRIVNGMNEGVSTRPENFSPLGVSYQDCAQDMTLQFSLVLSGFNGNASLQVWASTNSDCSSSSDRGIGSAASVCWAFPGATIDDLISTGTDTYGFLIRVQDLVGWQQAQPPASQAATPPTKGIEACSAQP